MSFLLFSGRFVEPSPDTRLDVPLLGAARCWSSAVGQTKSFARFVPVLMPLAASSIITKLITGSLCEGLSDYLRRGPFESPVHVMAGGMAAMKALAHDLQYKSQGQAQSSRGVTADDLLLEHMVSLLEEEMCPEEAKSSCRAPFPQQFLNMPWL